MFELKAKLKKRLKYYDCIRSHNWKCIEITAIDGIKVLVTDSQVSQLRYSVAVLFNTTDINIQSRTEVMK